MDTCTQKSTLWRTILLLILGALPFVALLATLPYLVQ
jgi:hypothetical protein